MTMSLLPSAADVNHSLLYSIVLWPPAMRQSRRSESDKRRWSRRARAPGFGFAFDFDLRAQFAIPIPFQICWHWHAHISMHFDCSGAYSFLGVLARSKTHFFNSFRFDTIPKHWALDRSRQAHAHTRRASGRCTHTDTATRTQRQHTRTHGHHRQAQRALSVAVVPLSVYWFRFVHFSTHF